MQPLFNKRLRPDCNIYPSTETPSALIRILASVALCPAQMPSRATGTVEDRRSSVDYKGRLVKFEPQPIDSLQHSSPTQQLLFQATLTGKVEEHDSHKNRQESLPRDAWNRQQNTNGDQQDAQNVFANNSRRIKGWMTT